MTLSYVLKTGESTVWLWQCQLGVTGKVLSLPGGGLHVGSYLSGLAKLQASASASASQRRALTVTWLKVGKNHTKALILKKRVLDFTGLVWTFVNDSEQELGKFERKAWERFLDKWKVRLHFSGLCQLGLPNRFSLERVQHMSAKCVN